jgi:hypothetical protein
MRSSSCGSHRRAAAAAALVSAVAFSPLGCGAACDTSDSANPPERYTAGHASGDTYESSPWGGPLLPFPGGKQYELEHHLPFVPSDVRVYIGFAGEAVAPCAGNSCVIRRVDQQVIWIQNDTCSEFTLRVAASGNVMADAATKADTGAEGSSPIDGTLADQFDASVTTDATTPD